MISLLIKYKKSILIVTLLFFLGSIVYLGLDAYSRSSNSLVAAMVGSEPITYRDLYRISENRATLLRNQGVDVDENMMKFLNQQTLAALISEEVLNQAAADAGMAVADYEIAYDIQSAPAFIQEGKFNKKAYEHAVKYTFGLTPAEFENQQRRQKLADRFRVVLYSLYKLTPAEVKYSYQLQHGNLKNFEENKADFKTQLLDSKMATAQQAFFDKFNKDVKIKTFLQD